MENQPGGGLRSAPELDERRQYQRIEPEGATAAARLGGVTVSWSIDNLSEGGALIAGRIEAAVGATVDLRVSLPGVEPIVLPSRIVRYVARDGGEFTAVMFLSTSDLLGQWIGDVVLLGLRAAFPDL